jgi:hypothetical protein
MPSSRRSARSGRTSGRSGADRGSQRGRRSANGSARSQRGSQRDRRSTNESGRSQRGRPESKTGLYAGLGGGGAVLFIILVIAFSGSGAGGSRPRSRGRGKTAPTANARPPVIRDWYQIGFSRGSSWKYRMRNRPRPPAREDVVMVAERMAVTQKRISKEGERLFVKGFVRAACGQ